MWEGGVPIAAVFCHVPLVSSAIWWARNLIEQSNVSSGPVVSRRFSRRPAARWAWLLGCVASLVAACHEEGTIQVKEISFSGLHAFSASQLEHVLATRKSGWLPWSARHYFDRAEFESDLGRIHAFYVDHGYPAQRISGVVVDLAADRSSVRAEDLNRRRRPRPRRGRAIRRVRCASRRRARAIAIRAARGRRAPQPRLCTRQSGSGGPPLARQRLPAWLR